VTDIADNLKTLRDEIAELARAAGRDPKSVSLVAVSKTKPVADLRAAITAGQISFAENYAQEFREKCEALSDEALDWHFIGHLQSNKAKSVVGRARLIQTLDRLSLAETIEKLAAKENHVQDCLIEIKLAGETTKSGCAPADAKALLKSLSQFSHIRVQGLMTIGSLTDNTAVTRQEFKSLRLLRDELNATHAYPHPLVELSMGMSSDYPIAIAEGATIVRVGTKIFGAR
jgi:pyridoxal phosphate enzyme (YggS family)